MKTMILAVALASLPAFASIGKVVVLDGKAARAADGGGAAVPLAVGTALELKDTLKVVSGQLKFELNDGSQIAIANGAQLTLSEAEFEGADCKSFLGTLKGGSLWTKVKKLLGGSRYEVKTERAVAGVRGTIFRIDADTLVTAAKGRRSTLVRVVEGVVRVNPSKKIAASVKGGIKPGERREVPGPKEITADEWDANYVELSKGQDYMVGTDLWEAAKLSEAEKNDAFQKWLDKQ
jgi:hypothetical protein